MGGKQEKVLYCGESAEVSQTSDRNVNLNTTALLGHSVHAQDSSTVLVCNVQSATLSVAFRSA